MSTPNNDTLNNSLNNAVKKTVKKVKKVKKVTNSKKPLFSGLSGFLILGYLGVIMG